MIYGTIIKIWKLYASVGYSAKDVIIFLNSKIAIFRWKNDFIQDTYPGTMAITLWYQEVWNCHRNEVSGDVNENNTAGN